MIRSDMMKSSNVNKIRLTSFIIVMCMVLTMIPQAAFAETETVTEDNAVYTGMWGSITSSGGDGTKENPYNKFEDAVKNVPDGGTIYITEKDNALLNIQDELGQVPFVIEKNVTIKPEPDAGFASLEVRAGGIVLGGNVTFENIRLEFANKYHDAIFANGHELTLINVSKTDSTREIDLFAGGLYDAVNDTNSSWKMLDETVKNPVRGEHGKITVKVNRNFADTSWDGTFGNIYAGSMNEPFDGSAEIFLIAEDSSHKLSVDEIYACGALEADPGNMFDIKEPKAPQASAEYFPTSGNVSITLDHQTVKKIDGNTGTSSKTGLNVATQYLYSTAVVKDIDAITVSEGQFAPQIEVSEGNENVAFSSLTIKRGAELDLSCRANWVTENFKGESDPDTGEEDPDLTVKSALTLAKDGHLQITGELTGATVLQTEGAFGGYSGDVLNEHVYVTSNTNGVEDSFEFYHQDFGYRIEYSAADSKKWAVTFDDIIPVLESFSFVKESEDEVKTFESTGADQYYDIEVSLKDIGKNQELIDSDVIYLVPFEYKVEDEKGNVYEDNGEGVFPELNVSLYVGPGVSEEYAMLYIERDMINNDFAAGSYEITVTYPTEKGQGSETLRVDVIEPEDPNGNPIITLDASAQNQDGESTIKLQDKMSITTEVNLKDMQDGDDVPTISGESLFFNLNGSNDPMPVEVSADKNKGTTNQIDITEENGFTIGQNGIVITYDDKDDQSINLKKKSIRFILDVAKALPKFTATEGTLEATYNGQRQEYSKKGITVDAVPESVKEEILNSIEILYKDAEGNLLEKAPVLPGVYDVIVSAAEGEKYSEAQQKVTTLEIKNADAQIELSGDVENENDIKVKAVVTGPESGMIPCGEVEFYKNGDSTPIETVGLSYGEAEYTFEDLENGEYNITAKYISSGPHNSCESESKSFTIDKAETPPEELSPVTITTENRTITFGDPADVSALFTIPEEAGAATYEITDGTGEGFLNDFALTVEKIGTFKIKVTTAATETHEAGSAEATLTVNAADLSSAVVSLEKIEYTHTGSSIEPGVTTVIFGNKPLDPSSDYDISYSNNTDVGTDAKVIITGKGNYTGTASATFTIKEADTEPEKPTPDPEGPTLEQTQATAQSELAAYAQAKQKENEYREEQKKEIEAAIASGNAAIEEATDADSVATALANAKAAIDDIKTDEELTQEEDPCSEGHSWGAWEKVSDTQHSRTCKNDADHKETAAHTASKAATCTAAAICKDCCESYGSKLGHAEVTDKAEAATCTTTGLTEGKHCSVCGTVTLKQKTVLAKGHSYGAYVTTKKAAIGTAGTQTATCAHDKSHKLTKTIPAAKTPTLSATKYTYNGKVKSPKVIIKDANGNTLSSADYTITMPSGRKNVGTYKVTIKGKGNYTGTITKSFKINPKGVTISKLSKAKKSFTVKWKKPSAKYHKQMTGYQIRYSTSSKMTKAKTVTVKSAKATSKKISKLKAKKKYYVQIRTYKTVKGVKYYSSWSAKKSVKTK